MMALIPNDPIPEINRLVIISGCQYIQFNINDADLVECTTCRMRSLINHRYNELYHINSCAHWQPNSSVGFNIRIQDGQTRILNRMDGIIQQFQQASTTSTELPPRYEDVCDAPPSYSL
jgi:hypothetical protein